MKKVFGKIILVDDNINEKQLLEIALNPNYALEKTKGYSKTLE